MSTHVNAVLTIDDKLLARRIRPFLRILILVYRRRARVTQQTAKLDYILLGVSFFGTGFSGELEVRGLAFGVVGTCPRYRGENVEGENSVRFGVGDRCDFAILSDMPRSRCIRTVSRLSIQTTCSGEHHIRPDCSPLKRAMSIKREKGHTRSSWSPDNLPPCS